MNIKKISADFRVKRKVRFSDLYSLLILTPADLSPLPEILPGQFVQVEIADSKTTYLRRPISVNFVDYEHNELWLLVRAAGDGTRHLTAAADGAIINIVLPLGRGFSIPESPESKILLIGGGVGVAPLLYFGARLAEAGIRPEFLLGARSASELLETEYFEQYGKLNISTEDGTAGEKGLVTVNSALDRPFDMIACCGPMPMMKAVAKIARDKGIDCEVSLENMMACGLGACLCCVEKNSEGHNVCVCTDGPVFNINQLSW